MRATAQSSTITRLRARFFLFEKMAAHANAFKRKVGRVADLRQTSNVRAWRWAFDDVGRSHQGS
jgi:hypothetical protein